MVIIVGFYIFVLFVNVCKHERPVPAFGSVENQWGL